MLIALVQELHRLGDGWPRACMQDLEWLHQASKAVESLPPPTELFAPWQDLMAEWPNAWRASSTACAAVSDEPETEGAAGDFDIAADPAVVVEASWLCLECGGVFETKPSEARPPHAQNAGA